MGDISTNFSLHEFTCKDGCGFDEVSLETIDILENIREYFGKRITINSGCRCAKHNKAVGGSKNSQHLKGTAADIVVKGVEPKEVADYIDNTFPNGLGLGRYNTFTHIDTRGRKARW